MTGAAAFPVAGRGGGAVRGAVPMLVAAFVAAFGMMLGTAFGAMLGTVFVAVRGAQGRELGPGQGDDGQAAFGGRQGVGEGQRGGLPGNRSVVAILPSSYACSK